jgi:hypothetical protein
MQADRTSSLCRKLSVAIALIGDSRIVFLDEVRLSAALACFLLLLCLLASLVCRVDVWGLRSRLVLLLVFMSFSLDLAYCTCLAYCAWRCSAVPGSCSHVSFCFASAADERRGPVVAAQGDVTSHSPLFLRFLSAGRGFGLASVSRARLLIAISAACPQRMDRISAPVSTCRRLDCHSLITRISVKPFLFAALSGDRCGRCCSATSATASSSSQR